MNKRIGALILGLWAVVGTCSCGGGKKQANAPSGLPDRVLAAQSSSTPTTFGGLILVNGWNDTIVPKAPISAGTSPGLMAISPTRNIAGAFDSATNTVYAVDTVKESVIGNIKLPGPTNSFILPTANPVGYAAVPSAMIDGFVFQGAIAVMNFSTGAATTIAVPGAQTVVSNTAGTQLLVFSNDSDSITVVNPINAVPPVDTSCLTNPPNTACTVIPGFDRPVNAIVSGSTAYILNCGAQCGGVQASVQTLDFNTLAVGKPLPVNGATMAVLSGSKLYVAGLGTPTGPTCASIAHAAKTAAKYCGTLDIVNLNTMTDPYFNNPATEIAITDGYHDRMDMSPDGQLFIGSYNCTNIGNIDNPSGVPAPAGEVRGCLSIYLTSTGSVIFPPDNGDVYGLASFITRPIEYVAEGGYLRVYYRPTDTLLMNSFVPQGTINIVGYVGGIEAIDTF